MAEAVTVEVYVPGVKPAEFIPNDSDPRSDEGRISQLLFADLVRVTVGLPVFAESLEVLFDVEPFCISGKERLVDENDNAGAIVTVRVIFNVAVA